MGVPLTSGGWALPQPQPRNPLLSAWWGVYHHVLAVLLRGGPLQLSRHLYMLPALTCSPAHAAPHRCPVTYRSRPASRQGVVLHLYFMSSCFCQDFANCLPFCCIHPSHPTPPTPHPVRPGGDRARLRHGGVQRSVRGGGPGQEAEGARRGRQVGGPGGEGEVEREGRQALTRRMHVP